MKITDYPLVNELKSNDVFLIDGPDGTRQISAEKVVSAGGEGDGGITVGSDDAYIVHRNTYRGKNLGSTYTDAQKAAIADGSFKDIYVGDYWEIGGVKYRVMDLDYFVYGVDGTHHAVIMPDTALQQEQFTTASSLATGYNGATIRTKLVTSKNLINSAFGSDHILSYQSALSSSVNSSGVVNAVNVDNVTVELPSSSMVLDSAYTAGNDGWLDWVGTPNVQLSAFAMNPKLIYTTDNWFVCTVPSQTQSIVINDTTDNQYFHISNHLTNVHNVRPVFAIK